MMYCIGFKTDEIVNEYVYNTHKKLLDLGFEVMSLGKLHSHITMKSPFEYDNLEELMTELTPLIEDLQVFEIEYSGSEQIEMPSQEIIWFKVTETQFLRNMHNSLVEKFPVSENGFDGEKFSFHTTLAIGQKLDLSWIKDAPKKTTISSVIIMASAQNEPGQFEIVQTYDLRRKTWN